MPDLQTLERQNKKTLQQLELENSAGGPTTAQKDYTTQKTREQMVQEHRANLGQSVTEAERPYANVNLRPELQIEEQPQGGMLDILGGAWKSTISPLIGLGQEAWKDIQGPSRTNLLNAAVVNPAKETFQKAMDPNRSVSERLGYGAASAIPMVGPMMADVGERVIPKLSYGTGPERKEALGELFGPAAVPTAVKGFKQLRRAGAEKRFGKAAAKIADSTKGELTQLEVEEALHLLDDQFKREFGTVGTKGKEKPAIDLRHVNPEELKDLSKEAVSGYAERNIKPIEGFLSKQQVNPYSAFQKALKSIGILESESSANLPPYALEYAKSFLKDRPLGELIQIRGELNGKLKTTQGLSGLDFNNFIRQSPAGKFYSTLLDGVRELIDTTIDNNAGPYAGAMKGVLTDFAKLTDLSEGLQRGAEKSAAIETAGNAKTLTEKTPLVRGLFSGATKGRLGYAGTAGQLTGEASGILGTPKHRIHQAGKMLEQGGWFSPPGRRAMSPVPEVNWSPAMAGVSPSNPLMPPSGPPNLGWAPPPLPNQPGPPPLPPPKQLGTSAIPQPASTLKPQDFIEGQVVGQQKQLGPATSIQAGSGPIQLGPSSLEQGPKYVNQRPIDIQQPTGGQYPFGADWERPKPNWRNDFPPGGPSSGNPPPPGPPKTIPRPTPKEISKKYEGEERRLSEGLEKSQARRAEDQASKNPEIAKGAAKLKDDFDALTPADIRKGMGVKLHNELSTLSDKNPWIPDYLVNRKVVKGGERKPKVNEEVKARMMEKLKESKIVKAEPTGTVKSEAKAPELTIKEAENTSSGRKVWVVKDENGKTLSSFFNEESAKKFRKNFRKED